MDANIPPQTISPRARTGLAIAALILGILAVFSSILLVGAFVGLLAIVLGAVHIRRRSGPNGMAWTGIALSVLSIVLSVGLGVLYFKGARAGFREVQKEWAAAAASEEEAPAFADWEGKPVPDFTVTSLDGQTVKLSDLKGRRVVLDFWATWCPPCRQEIPHFIQLAKENPQNELTIVGVSAEDEATLREFVEKEGLNYLIVSEDELPAPFDAIEAIPTTFFIDRNGLIQNVVVGYHDYEHLKGLALAEDLTMESDETQVTEP